MPEPRPEVTEEEKRDAEEKRGDRVRKPAPRQERLGVRPTCEEMEKNDEPNTRREVNPQQEVLPRKQRLNSG